MSAATRKVSENLARRLGDRKFDMWFGPSTRFSIEGERLAVITDSQYVADWIRSHFTSDLRDAAHQTLGDAATVDIRVEPRNEPPRLAGTGAGALRLASEPPDAAAAQRTVTVSGNGSAAGKHAPPARAAKGPRGDFITPLRHRLEDFVIGESNRLAYRAATHLAEATSDGGLGPVFIYGECGLGKTHLLQGTCLRLLEAHPASRVRYTTGEQFTNEYINAIQKNTVEEFRRRVRSLDLLAIDDVHFLSNKNATQSEFLHTLDAIRMCGARIIMASDEHPRHLRQINHALVSRFMAGIVARIERPDRAMRARIIAQIANRRGLRINDRAVEIIAGHCAGSVREIEGALMRLEAMRAISPEAGGEVGCVLVEALFRNESLPGRPIRVDVIIDRVCERLGVDRADLLGATRHRRVVLARGLISHLARDMTTMSFPEIGRAVGRRNHSTVLTAARRVARQIECGETVELGDGRRVVLADFVDELRAEIRRANRT